MLADAEQRGYVTRIPILTHDKVEGRRANTLIPAWLKRWIIDYRPHSVGRGGTPILCMFGSIGRPVSFLFACLLVAGACATPSPNPTSEQFEFVCEEASSADDLVGVWEWSPPEKGIELHHEMRADHTYVIYIWWLQSPPLTGTWWVEGNTLSFMSNASLEEFHYQFCIEGRRLTLFDGETLYRSTTESRMSPLRGRYEAPTGCLVWRMAAVEFVSPSVAQEHDLIGPVAIAVYSSDEQTASLAELLVQRPRAHRHSTARRIVVEMAVASHGTVTFRNVSGAQHSAAVQDGC